jgi:hypothetical protein
MAHLNLVQNAAPAFTGTVTDRVWLVPHGDGQYLVYTTANVVAICAPLPRREAERVAREWAEHTGSVYDEVAVAFG